jgi:NAD(P)-dependent dehydrogenase (short-subunit alcohol dehydrogenase family)
MSPQTATLAASIADNDMHGRVCLVTGASRGRLGKATALGLARLGATVVLLRPRRAAAFRRRVTTSPPESGNPPRLHHRRRPRVVRRDPHRRAGADARATRCSTCCVHNAGVNPTKRRSAPTASSSRSPSIISRPFCSRASCSRAAAAARRTAARASSPCRPCSSASAGIAFERRAGRSKLDRAARLHRSRKLANVLFTYELAERLAGTGITANCVDPGLVATDLMREARALPARAG